MRYWWVNQNQTFDQEISGGYLWSPKRNVDGGRNPFYESMREIALGDLILSFKDTFIRAVGIFEEKGTLLISPVAHKSSLEQMGIATTSIVNVGRFTEGQKSHLDFHRNFVFLESKRS